MAVTRIRFASHRRALLMYIVLICSFALFTSCGSKQEAPTSPTAPSATVAPTSPTAATMPTTSDLLSQKFVDIMKDGRYTMTLKIFAAVNGELEDVMEATMSMDGEAMASKIDLGDTMSMSTVMKDGKIYLISHDMKTVMVMDASKQVPAGTPQAPEIKLDGIVYKGKGKADFMGKMLEYEEYTTEGGIVRYFFEGNELKGIENTFDTTTTIMEISELTDTVDDSMFTIPSDYKVTNLNIP
ncbi:hypothetical protein [Youngiibacter fragilis]|uniref:Uncharacterized protein n=1 Tax=Youngiibacter fragilis 232.1 TaxID=994573 RepID=V7IA72_9CLOT|nr:hypothetical protein [Youngiibacter fragilis]ETA82196.1 hypothetical protein T472_0202335 [Youngiibacter fragilis 232.1]